MRRVEFIMGMPITIDIPKAIDDKPFIAAFERLQAVEKRFSPFLPDSELSRFRRDELREADLSAEMKKIVRECEKAEKDTNGYFSAYFEGKFNPTGYVKGYGINEAGKVVQKAGFGTYCVSAGGDILARSNSNKVWNIGIQDPRRKKYLTSQVSIKNGAVATSGTYERGLHIINPKTGKPADKLLSLTVIGPDIIKADVLATAAFAMGHPGEDFVNRQKGYKALSVTPPKGKL